MGEITILGKVYPILEEIAEKDSFQFRNDSIVLKSSNNNSKLLLDELLREVLYDESFQIYEQMKKNKKVDVIGNLDFEIVDKIDKKENRIAKMKGNKILIKKKIIMLPKSVLEYIIAHEIAHIAIKRHTKKFWKTVELICPDYEKAKESLNEYTSLLNSDF
jgi:predicted metal-dependent hydrolase